jgi:cell filamentation protein, protein adenylyltransferase
MDSGDPSAAMLGHVIEQTVAAQRLEGWRPTEENLRALVELASGQTTFGDYLGRFRSRHPPSPPPRRTIRRKRPYLIPGTTVLRNNFGTSSAEVLGELEFVAAAGRIAQWHRLIGTTAHGADALDADALGADALDPRRVHQHVFADVYSWAGELRVTELGRGDVFFARKADLASMVGELCSRARALPDRIDARDSARLAYEFARWYADYNQAHPFREGNGRTGTLLLHTLAAVCGHRLDLTGVTRAEWYAASRDSMPVRHGANHRPFIPIFLRALSVRDDPPPGGCGGHS